MPTTERLLCGALGGAAITWLVPTMLLRALGFTGTGIAKGSWGATLMSGSARTGLWSGILASLQRMGQAGMGVQLPLLGALMGLAAAYLFCSQERDETNAARPGPDDTTPKRVYSDDEQESTEQNEEEFEPDSLEMNLSEK